MSKRSRPSLSVSGQLQPFPKPAYTFLSDLLTVLFSLFRNGLLMSVTYLFRLIFLNFRSNPLQGLVELKNHFISYCKSHHGTYSRSRWHACLFRLLSNDYTLQYAYTVCDSFVLSFFSGGLSHVAKKLTFYTRHEPTLQKIRFMYFQKWNCAASFPVPTYLWAI